MANKVKWWWLPAICSFFLFSCVNELDETKGITGKKEISFRANKISATVTKSADSNTAAIESDSCGRELFLGLIGNDSLFLTMREEENLMPLSGDIFTKAGDENKPSQFQITGFKDNDNTPYTDLVITSEDNWETYSPKLYWPYQYEAIHFFASTLNANNSLFTPHYTPNNKVTFSYTAPHSTEETDAEDQTDIIYAVSPGNTEAKANRTDGVELEFRHILSGVQFYIPTQIGDAAVEDAKITLNNIITTGECTVTDQSVTWILPDSPTRGTYSQDIANGETTFPRGEYFKLVPQVLDAENNQFTISFKVGTVEHSYSGKLSSLASEWISGKKYIYTLVKRDEVKVNVGANVEEINSQPVLKEITIVNSGFSRSYLRAAIIGAWYTEDGKIISSWDIDLSNLENNDTNTGTLVRNDNWSNYWKLGSDGFYYYKNPVEPGYPTEIPLLNSYTLKALGVANSTLKVHIAVQAINEEVAGAVWNEVEELNDNN